MIEVFLWLMLVPGLIYSLWHLTTKAKASMRDAQTGAHGIKGRQSRRMPSCGPRSLKGRCGAATPRRAYFPDVLQTHLGEMSSAAT